MTREEEINKAKNLFCEKVLEDGIYYGQKECFEEGAKWADEHPKSPWINVNDDLPCNHKYLLENETYTKDVLVVVRDSFEPSRRYITMMNMHNKIGPAIFTKYHWKSELHYRVTHWMPIPELPKE